MGESVHLFRGVFRGGVVVPDGGCELPEGTAVEFGPAATGPLAYTPEERAEFAGWEKLGDEAWATIDWGEGEIARDSG